MTGLATLLRTWVDRIGSLFDVGGDWWSDEEEGS